MPYSQRPPVVRDCVDCSGKGAMKLQNAAGTPPRNIPLLYICSECGSTLTIPPPRSPVGDV